MKTIEELNKIRVEKKVELDLRKNTEADTREKHILVCHGTGCTSSKSPQILENFNKLIKEKELNSIINTIDKYEIYIYKIYIYLKKYSNLPPVEWLKKTKN